MRRSLALCACLALGVLSADVEAATRRALLIGVNTYADGSAGAGRSRWHDLRGSLNDVQAMRSLLVARYGFDAANVRVLTESAATRARILELLRGHLVEPAAKGDLHFFYFTGHGSQLPAAGADEMDRLDETIVPADSSRGARDIRDGELRRLFNDAIDRGARVVAVFDSCHSGSITRFLGPGRKGRFLPATEGGPMSAREPDPRPPPEERGAIVFSASREGEVAREARDERGFWRGAFSLSLSSALRSASPSESADDVFRRTHALMAANSLAQSPVLAGTAEERARPFLGDAIATARGIVAAALSVEGERVVLDAGLAAGLGEGAELESNGTPAVRLRVDSTTGLGSAVALVVGGDPASVQPGDLFRLDRWAPAQGSALPVHVPASLDDAGLVTAFATLHGAKEFDWIEDPTDREPSVWFGFDGTKWLLHRKGRGARALATLDAADVRRHLDLEAERPAIFSRIPPTTGLREALESRASDSDRIEFVTAVDARYALVGRIVEGRVSFAWLALDAATKPLSGLPRRTDWIPFEPGREEECARALHDLALGIARLRAWLTLEGPPRDDRFPFRLALLDAEGAAIGGDVVLEGDELRPALQANAVPGHEIVPRYVYLFSVDGHGRRRLIFPGPQSGNGENRLPTDPGGKLPVHHLIPLGASSLRVEAPFGPLTLVLLTSEEPLVDPRVLEGEPVRTRYLTTQGSQGGRALTAFLRDVGSRLAARLSTPVGWSVERVALRTVGTGAKP